MGLALEDFLLLTPFEFTATRKAFYQEQKRQSEEAFAVAAWQAFKITCPGEGKQFSYQDFLPPHMQPEEVKPAPLSEEKSLERYEQLKKKWAKQ